MSFVPHSLETWSVTVPQLSYSNPYLLHQLLAHGAFHKSFECYHKDNLTRQDLIEADRHRKNAGELQAQAVKLYIPELGKACPDTCVALLSFNVIFSAAVFGWAVVAKKHEQLQSSLDVFQSGSGTPDSDASTESRPSRKENAPRSTSYLNCFINSLNVLRGNEAIIDEYWAWILTSEIGCLFKYPPWDILDDIPPGARRSLEWMRVQVCQLPQLCHMSYSKDIGYLSRTASVATNPQKCANQAFVVDYAAKMCKENVAGLERHDTLSLVMAGFWAACFGLAIDRNSNRWWGKGWANGLLSEIMDLLRLNAEVSGLITPSGWEVAMQWPLMTLETSTT